VDLWTNCHSRPSKTAALWRKTRPSRRGIHNWLSDCLQCLPCHRCDGLSSAVLVMIPFATFHPGSGEVLGAGLNFSGDKPQTTNHKRHLIAWQSLRLFSVPPGCTQHNLGRRGGVTDWTSMGFSVGKVYTMILCTPGNHHCKERQRKSKDSCDLAAAHRSSDPRMSRNSNRRMDAAWASATSPSFDPETPRLPRKLRPWTKPRGSLVPQYCAP